MTLTTQTCDRPSCGLVARSNASYNPSRLLWERRLSSSATQRPTGRRTMSQKDVSLHPRAGLSPNACGSPLSLSEEPGVEVARQRLIKAYLRRPVLEQVELGDQQPASLAEALERAECLLASIESVAA